MTVKSTPTPMKTRWDDYYKANPNPAWESFNLRDMSDFIARIELSEINTVLDIGCGRGIRALAMILLNDILNRENVKIVGIDLSITAIEFAREFLEKVKSGTIPAPLTGICDSVTDFKVDIEFYEQDFLSDLPSQINQSYDLIIDWMCFHELFKAARDEYIEKVARLSSQFYIVNCFSTKESAVLPEIIKGVPKQKFSKKNIQDLFGKYFDIMQEISYPTNKLQNQSDGFFAAKDAYLLRKKINR